MLPLRIYRGYINYPKNIINIKIHKIKRYEKSKVGIYQQ